MNNVTAVGVLIQNKEIIRIRQARAEKGLAQGKLLTTGF